MKPVDERVRDDIREKARTDKFDFNISFPWTDYPI